MQDYVIIKMLLTKLCNVFNVEHIYFAEIIVATINATTVLTCQS